MRSNALSRFTDMYPLRFGLFILALGIGTLPMQAQLSWDSVGINPFGIPGPSSHYRFAFDDLDLDGDTDILALDAYGQSAPFLYFQNTGSPTNPAFSLLPEPHPFGLPHLDLLNVIHLRDMDGDQDPDLVAGGMKGLLYFENIGRPGAPAFAAPQSNPFGIQIPPGSNTLIPAFGDLDKDGKTDLLLGDYQARLFFYKNMGAEHSPMYAAPVAAPFGFVEPDDQAIFLAPVLEDINGDGLLDLLTGYNPGAIVLYPNTGTPEKPEFQSKKHSPLGSDWDNFPVWAMPIFMDLDGDGDRDFFISTFSEIRYYKCQTNK